MKAVFEKHNQFLIRGRRVVGFRGWLPAFHPHIEMIYVVKGYIKTVVDGTEHILQPGELSVVFPYIPHSYEHAPEAEALVLTIAPEAILFEDVLRTKQPVCHYTDGGVAYPLITRAVELIRGGNQKTAQCYANAVLGEFLEQVILRDADGGDRNVVIQVLQYCTEHFTEPISLKSVANALYLSQSYASKIFSEKLHCSFREYINSLRIEKAKTMLQNTGEPIAAVMDACGFSNQSSFNRIFRDFCGTTPVQFRKQNDNILEKRNTL